MLRSRSQRQNSLGTCPSSDSLALGSQTDNIPVIVTPATPLIPSRSPSPRRITLRRPLKHDEREVIRRSVYLWIFWMLFSACVLGLLYLTKTPSWTTADPVSENAPPVSKLLGELKNKISSAKFGASHLVSDVRNAAHVADKPGIVPAATSASTRKSRWPPLITAIPEVASSAESMRAGVTSAAIDAQFCPEHDRCRILLPLWIGEQESRGRMHLTQLVHLAAALNRTLVLPNVGKSRLGLCGKWSFEAYYDVGSIAAQTRHIGGGGRVMLMDDFRTWLDMRPTPPLGRLVFFQENSTAEAQGTLVESGDELSLFLDEAALQVDDPRLKNAYCLKTKFRGLKLDGYHPLSLYMTPPDPLATGPPDVPSGDLVLNILRHGATHVGVDSYTPETQDPLSLAPTTPLAEPDVLLVHWDLRHLPFTSPTPPPPLEYSAQLWAHAQRLAGAHAPYAAVHWRMETVDPAVLPACADALVDTLSTLLADPSLGAGVRTVWLATDVPWARGDAAELVRSPAQRSNTFRAFASEHFEALDILTAAFAAGGVLEDWRLTGLGEEIQRYRAANAGEEMELAYEDDTGMLWEDSGIWGILDKMAAMQATLFVSAARGCGRVSSFTRQIIEYRAETQSRDAPRNVVELFG